MPNTPPGAPIAAAPLRYGAIDVANGCDLGSAAFCCPELRLANACRSERGLLSMAGIRLEQSSLESPHGHCACGGEDDWTAGLATEPPRARQIGRA
jgi:hypothetical protein